MPTQSLHHPERRPARVVGRKIEVPHRRFGLCRDIGNQSRMKFIKNPQTGLAFQRFKCGNCLVAPSLVDDNPPAKERFHETAETAIRESVQDRLGARQIAPLDGVDDKYQFCDRGRRFPLIDDPRHVGGGGNIAIRQLGQESAAQELCVVRVVLKGLSEQPGSVRKIPFLLGMPPGEIVSRSGDAGRYLRRLGTGSRIQHRRFSIGGTGPREEDCGKRQNNLFQGPAAHGAPAPFSIRYAA